MIIFLRTLYVSFVNERKCLWRSRKPGNGSFVRSWIYTVGCAGSHMGIDVLAMWDFCSWQKVHLCQRERKKKGRKMNEMGSAAESVCLSRDYLFFFSAPLWHSDVLQWFFPSYHNWSHGWTSVCFYQGYRWLLLVSVQETAVHKCWLIRSFSWLSWN